MKEVWVCGNDFHYANQWAFFRLDVEVPFLRKTCVFAIDWNVNARFQSLFRRILFCLNKKLGSFNFLGKWETAIKLKTYWGKPSCCSWRQTDWLKTICWFQCLFVARLQFSHLDCFSNTTAKLMQALDAVDVTRNMICFVTFLQLCELINLIECTYFSMVSHVELKMLGNGFWKTSITVFA